MLRVGLVGALAITIAATSSSALAQPPPGLSGGGQPSFPPFGLDLSAQDSATAPGDDFFQHVNGAWLARTPIPPGGASITMGAMELQRVEGELHDLMEALAAPRAPRAQTLQPKTTEGKIGAFYAAFMDEARIERLGAAPIAVELKAIDSAASRSDVARLMGRTVDHFYGSFFQPSIDVDLRDAAQYAVYLDQAGLGLPDRDNYLTPEFAERRAAYQAYVQRLLTLVGWPDPPGDAASIVALETRIAQASWTRAAMRDPATQYNPMTPSELQAYAPGFDWRAFLVGAKLSAETRVIADQNTAFPKLAAIYADTPVATLKAWLAFNVADNAAPYLSSPFQSAYFEFRQKTLAGQREQAPRWKRAILAVSGSDCIYAARACFGTLDWAVGQAYARRYFTAEKKAQAEALVTSLKAAFRARIERLHWMSPSTKAEALRKLDTYVIKVGYPDKLRDYSGVVVSRNDLIGDIRWAAETDWAFHVARGKGPVDRTDWSMTPQTVDAYHGTLRDIVFPAAILQPPYFDSAADPAVNYGAIGAIMGHEMTRGFDDQGRRVDAGGALRDWWTPEDAKGFEARAMVLGEQYAAYEPAPGAHINPELTMGENIADFGGLEIALDAYHASLNGRPAPVLGGLTGDQRFFMAFAQVWRGKADEDAIREQTAGDPHAYRKFRVNGVVRNVDAWYAAFDVHPGQALYLPTDRRARIW